MVTADKKSRSKKTGAAAAHAADAPTAADAVSTVTRRNGSTAAKVMKRFAGRIAFTKQWAINTAKLFHENGQGDNGLVWSELKVIEEAADKISQGVYRLAEAGWKVPKLGAAAKFQVDDLVYFIPKAQARILKEGAYTAANLETLTVVSIHGQKLKLAMVNKDSSAGEVIGLHAAKSVRHVGERNRRARD